VDLDLCHPDRAKTLAAYLSPSDTLIIAVAKIPCRNDTALIRNTWMTTTLCEALARQPVAHVVNVSSDAVYGPIAGAITEKSRTRPTSLLGVMHLAREAALLSVAPSLLIVRPVALFGHGYPHDTYGPNAFLRDALNERTITLCGEGSELRDHMHVRDAARVIVDATLTRQCGILNIATGRAHTFHDIAIAIAEHTGAKIVSRSRPPLPEVGRTFDTSRLQPFISTPFTSPLEVSKWASK
jgi:nucleoside-diphosphate-sugar epimerase